jgi:uncharacterized membrane protein
VTLHNYVKVDVIEERKQRMKRVLLTLLAVVLVLGLFAATGYAGYRFGYIRGAQTTANGDTSRPQLRPFDNFDRRGMPMRKFGDDFGRGFHRGFHFGGFPRMGMGFGFFSPLMFLARIAVFVLIIWFVYWLFTRSGWRLTRQTIESTPSKTETEIKTENPENE